MAWRQKTGKCCQNACKYWYPVFLSGLNVFEPGCAGEDFPAFHFTTNWNNRLTVKFAFKFADVKKRTIYVLIGLMLVGVFGIIGIQYFIIKNAVELRRLEFKRSVMNALLDVTHEIKKEKTLEMMEQFNQGSIKLISNKNGKLEYVFVDKSGSAVITRVSGDSLYVKEVMEDYKDIGKADPLQFRQRVEIAVGDTETYLYHPLDEQEDKSVHSLEVKYQIYREMMRDKERMEKNLPLHDRVFPDEINKKLQSAFRSRGVEADFVFGIIGPDKDDCIYYGPEAEKYRDKIDSSGFMVDMFPGEIKDNIHKLSVYFPNFKWDMIGRVGMILSISGIFLLIVIGVFVVTIRTILWQKRLSEIKNDFISNMTHELKTPISTISLACEALTDKSISIEPGVRDTYLGMIRSENSRLAMLVDKVLRNAILDKGELKLKTEKTDLNQLISSTVAQFDLRIKSKGGVVKLKLEKDLPEIYIDKMHVGNAISNLIDNAIKYSHEKPKITIKSFHEDNYVVMEVSDNGIGISPENQKNIFEKFFRVPTGNVHNVKGFGLGLSYVKNVIEKSGGTIFVKSELNKGTTFTIKLPVYDK